MGSFVEQVSLSLEWRKSEKATEHRLQHCLEWVMRVHTSKLTPDSVVTYLFHDCEHSLWLFCLMRHVAIRTLVCNDQSTVHLNWPPVLRVCAVFEVLTEFCFAFRFGFRATLLDFTSRIERLHFCHHCEDVWRVLAHFLQGMRSRTPVDKVCIAVFQF